MTLLFKHFRWRIWLLSIVSLAISCTLFFLMQWIYLPTDDDCTWFVHPKSGRISIRQIVPGGATDKAGIMEGDELLAIAGTPIAPRQTRLAQELINKKKSGTLVTYEVLRFSESNGRSNGKGEILRLKVRLRKPIQLFNWILLFNGLVFWGVGMLVALANPERKTGRHFFYISCMVLLFAGLSQGNFSTLPFLLLGLTFSLRSLAAALFCPLLLHFFLRFPHPFGLRKKRIFLGLMYGISFVVSFLVPNILAVTTGWWGSNQPPPPLLARYGLLPMNLLALITPSVAIFFFWLGVFRLSEHRRRAFWLPLLLVTGFALNVIVMIIMQTREGGNLIFQRQLYLFLLPLPLIPLSFAYAIVQHGLFDVRRVLLRWMAYCSAVGFALMLTAAGFVGVFLLSYSLLPRHWAGLAVVPVVIPALLLFQAAWRRIDRLFHRDQAQARAIILGALRQPGARLSQDRILKNLQEAIQEAYHPHKLFLTKINQGQFLLPALGDKSLDHPETEDIPDQQTTGAFRLTQKFNRLLKLPQPTLRHAIEEQELVQGLNQEEAEWISKQNVEARAYLDQEDLQLMILIMLQGEPFVALLLGSKFAELAYTREDRQLLTEVAQATSILLETASLHERLLAQERLSQELETARKIQQGLLPRKLPSIPSFQLAFRLDPALETGGDLLMVKKRPNGRWMAAVGDVSGKGLPAALYMSQAVAILEFASQENRGLDQILAATDRALRNLFDHHSFLTLSLVEWNEEGHYSLARAGHPPVLLIHGQEPESAKPLNPKGRGLGMRPAGEADWEVVHGVLDPTHWLVLYSDGITEAMDDKGHLFGMEAMAAQIQKLWKTGSTRAACESVFHYVARFNQLNHDDRTLLILGREAR